MDIHLGADIISSDGEKFGTVDSLVVDPHTGEINSIIIRKGLFFPTDRIIPIERVAEFDHERVVLNMSSEQIDELPEYMDANYMAPPAGYYGSAGYMWPAAQSQYLATVATDIMIDEQVHQRDPDAVILSEGTLIVDSAGEELGRITELDTDDRGRITAFKVEQGIFRHHERYIPVHFIARADDNVVVLSVDKATIEERVGR
jgi:uncharacterized protein YrrD